MLNLEAKSGLKGPGIIAGRTVSAAAQGEDEKLLLHDHTRQGSTF